MTKMFQIDITEDVSYKTPKEIIEAQCTLLSEDTHGLVLGRVQDYSGEIDNYIKPGFKRALAELWNVGEDYPVEIQSALGELSESTFTYDFFLTSKYAPNYKYRIMFFRYGIGGYPVKVVYDADIKVEASNEDYSSIKNEEDFNNFLKQLLSSEDFSNVVKNLYAFNKKIEVEETL